jgi:hypothetical protein
MSVSCECFQVEVFATSCLPVQRSPIETGVSECDHESSTMRRSWPTRTVAPLKKNYNSFQRCAFLLVLSISLT